MCNAGYNELKERQLKITNILENTCKTSYRYDKHNNALSRLVLYSLFLALEINKIEASYNVQKGADITQGLGALKRCSYFEASYNVQKGAGIIQDLDSLKGSSHFFLSNLIEGSSQLI